MFEERMTVLLESMIMTSVKDFRIDDDATSDTLGRGVFRFSDRYSVFDWGEMPDHIPGKGASLCTMGAFNFELLDREGIPHHYRGVEENGNFDTLENIEDPPTVMGIELSQVPELSHGTEGFNYEAFHREGDDNYLIPLEIVFRNEVPAGSSLRRRKEPEELGLNLEEWPDEAVSLPDPMVEFSTKFEEQDRYVTEEEADRIAGEVDLETLRDRAREVNRVITRQAEKQGFRHDDGKIECFYFDGTVKVADVVGTFDENRFSKGGQLISKEYLRQYYRENQPEWYESIREAKRRSRDENSPKWKSFCDVEPKSLPAELVQSVSELYRAGANAYTDRKWFDVPEIEEVLDRLRSCTETG
jgi:phosphoribosylaminoimidazole-succinocarboxamide synthase